MTKAQTQKINEPEKKETALIETKKPAEESFDALKSLATPFTFLRRFTEEVEKLFADLGVARETMPFTDEWMKAAWSPKIEIKERGDKIFVSADLPGMKPEEIKIEVLDNRLTIEGERRKEHEERGKGFYRSERRYGSFYRDIPLPKYVNAEQTKASFRNGVLEITLPSAAKPKTGKRIEIGG